MKKVVLLSLLTVTMLFAVAQKKTPVTVFLHGQAGFMPYGIFKEYTGAGLGTGLQTVYLKKHKLRPQLEATVHLFSTNRILFVFENGQTTGPKGFIATVFPGVNYEPADGFELAISAGPAWDNDGPDIGIKPYAAYYPGKKKAVKVHASLTHLFSPGIFSKKNTGIISMGLAVKLF